MINTSGFHVNQMVPCGLVLLTLAVCLFYVVHAVEPIKLVVGQPFSYSFKTNVHGLKIRDVAREELPVWLRLRENDNILEGVSRPEDVGKTILRLSDEHGLNAVMEIIVSEEFKNPCGAERNTVWMEIHFDVSMNDLNVSQLMRIVDSLSNYFDISSALLRVYTGRYLEGIRIMEVMETGIDEQQRQIDEITVVIWKVSCEEVDENAINLLEKALALDEDGLFLKQKLLGWRLTKGMITSRNERLVNSVGGISSEFAFATNEPVEHLESTTAFNTTARASRSTKKVDSPPVRRNSLPSFHCDRGSLCEFVIPNETFVDVEDGDTRSLSLSVYPLFAENNWLILDTSRQVLHGIPLHQGQYEFRLEARDSANQMNSAAFSVVVDEAAPTNHLFILDVQHNFERLTKDPDTLYAFVQKLANSLGDRHPQHIVIREIKAAGNDRSVVAFSNGTLSPNNCQRRAIDIIKHRMLTRKRDRIKIDFVRAMESRFHVRNARVELIGTCAKLTTISRGASDVTTTTTLAPKIDSPLPILRIAIVVAALLSLVLVLCTITSILMRWKKKKTVQSVYISKGLPVVFPEEIPQEDEAAVVSTPMLVKEERPPLIISQHENPLYKPPPPLSVTSSPRPRNSAAHQRQPPPYVPP